MKRIIKAILILLACFSSYVAGVNVVLHNHEKDTYDDYQQLCSMRIAAKKTHEDDFRLEFIDRYRSTSDFWGKLEELRQMQQDACSFKLVKNHFERNWMLHKLFGIK